MAGAILSTDPANPLGAGEGIAIHLGSAFVVGGTRRRIRPTGPASARLVERGPYRLQPHPVRGGDLRPLFGWWQIPSGHPRGNFF